jgi:hypothetical protein
MGRERGLTNTQPHANEQQGGDRPSANPVPAASLEETSDTKHTGLPRETSCPFQPITKHTNPSTDNRSRAEHNDRLSSKNLRSVSREPPVTKETLSELDVPRIVFNPKLRHDVNFDPDLHFRPNLDGEKGRRKAQKAIEFWNHLRAQLEFFMTDQVTFMSNLNSQDWSLPLTLRAVGQILATLVPPEDRSVVEEILNVDLLMQQFSKGVADLEKLALWLSRTLKSHCAPMRDEWVDEMVNQLSNGYRNRDVPLLAQGLQTLLTVLEAMKLVS